MKYLDDFKDDQTVHFKWNTNDAAGASITPTTPGTLYVYKDDEIATEVTTGITDSRDHDGLTGVHHCKIVTTDAFYATGHDYFVVLKAATIDGQTVNATLAHFSIENRSHQKMAEAAIAAKFLFTAGPPGYVQADLQRIVGNSTLAVNLGSWATAGVGISDTDGKCLISAKAQDLAASLSVNAKRLNNDATAASNLASLANAGIENVSGWRYTAKALEQAPAGGGGSCGLTADEWKQVRKALGITGATLATTGTGHLDTVKANIGVGQSRAMD